MEKIGDEDAEEIEEIQIVSEEVLDRNERNCSTICELIFVHIMSFQISYQRFVN